MFFFILSNFLIIEHLVIGESLNQSKILSPRVDLKFTFSLQFAKFLSLVSYRCSSEVFPKYSKTKDVPFRKHTLKSIWINNLLQNVLIL